MSNLHSDIISGSNTTINISNNNNNNNSKSEQELIFAKLNDQSADSKRPTSATHLANSQVLNFSSTELLPGAGENQPEKPDERQYAAPIASESTSYLSGAPFVGLRPALSSSAANLETKPIKSMSSKSENGRKQQQQVSHHMSHHQLQQHLQQQQQQQQQQQLIQQQQQHYHQHAASHQHLSQQMSANLISGSHTTNHHQMHHHHSTGQLGGGSSSNNSSSSTTAPSIASNKLIVSTTSKSASNLLQAAPGGNRQSPPVDRSDSASLPSSTSTSESMFKRRLGNGRRWYKLWPCGSSPDSPKSSSTRFKPLAILLFILLLFATGALIIHFKLFGFSISCSYYGSNKPSEGFNMKNGAEFYLGITEMLQAMDSTVDPCNDFYNYACGAWTRRHSIPGDESRIDTFSVMRTDLGNKLKDLLEEDIDASDSEATIKAKTLYKSCVNESLIDKRGPEPLLQLLDSMFGGWPLLNGDQQKTMLTTADPTSSTTSTTASSSSSVPVEEMNWVQLMAILRTYNNEIIIGQTVGSHEHNSSMHAIRLYPAGLGLPSADYYNSSSRQFKAYEKYLISTAQLLKANNTNLMSDIRDLLEFETGLANISKPFERQGGATYHRMTIARLQKYTPAIDWAIYFKFAFPDLAINSTEQVGLYGLDFFMDIAHLINTTASKKTVINYLLWRFVMNRVNNLGKQFANNQHEYAAEISGAKVQAPRHKVCVDYVNGNMGMAVSSLYVKRHFDAGSKQQAEVMIANIRQSFLEILNQVDWMDAETRTEAIVKAKSMLQHIGFPLWIIDPVQLDSEYSHLNFSNEHYFENVIQLIQSFAKETRIKLRQPSERDKWTVAPSIINAHYLRTKNLMSFPAGILQPPIYHTRYPKSLNYGGIGSIIGHEITHGFDNDGRHHDYQGNQRLWWHPNTIDRFIIRSQCMVRQYDDYQVEIRGENVTISGIRTLGENIADNGGLKEAFMAYRKYELENGPEDSLPGLNLTHHQMFFIKFAQNWCQNMTPQSMMNALKTWRHPLGRFRVIGTLSNLNEFSTAFNCPANTPMNSANKCKVW